MTIWQLADEIADFLIGSGGPYREGWNPFTEYLLLRSLAEDNYVLHRKATGEIVLFVNYWLTNQPYSILVGDIPGDTVNGQTLVVIDAAGNARDILRALRPKLRDGGMAWFSEKRKRMRHFPNQRCSHG